MAVVELAWVLVSGSDLAVVLHRRSLDIVLWQLGRLRHTNRAPSLLLRQHRYPDIQTMPPNKVLCILLVVADIAVGDAAEGQEV